MLGVLTGNATDPNLSLLSLASLVGTQLQNSEKIFMGQNE
jgi:hypothetical protein